MKKKLFLLVLSFSVLVVRAQQAKEVRIHCDSLLSLKGKEEYFSNALELVFLGKANNIKSFFAHTKIKNSEGEENVLFEWLKKIDNKLTTSDKYFDNHFSKSIDASGKSPDTLRALLTPSLIGSVDTFTVLISPDGKNSIAYAFKKRAANPLDNKLQKAEDPVIVTAEMLSTINGTNSCQPCDVYTEKQRIGSKKDRVHSTDYIVIYDASLKNDAYTICKHVFEKKQGVLYERYVKVNPKMFAPGVGSQIKFEVVNQPLNRPIKITVDEQDLFNSGASQFSSLISGLVNTNIITPVSSSGKDGEQSGAKGSLITTILDVISVQVLNYVMQFKISSCSLLEHQNNLAGIISNINRVYSINATNSAELYAQLKSKIETEIEGEQNVANALKKLDAIIAALRSLENLQPIAYTTLRAKNRDYIEIKYTDANNVMSKPENIRISGGMKIDFSGGFILTGLRDYTYVLKDATVRYTPQGSSVERDTTGNIIVKEEDGNNQVGVCLLSHFYPRISSHYNLGGTVGLMTSTNLNLRVMLGGSLLISSLFGSNNRITFSGGVVWGKVKRLSTQHNDYFNQARFVNNIPQFYSASAAPTPIDKSERSWFFAITMNFGGN